MTPVPDSLIAATGDGLWQMDVRPPWAGALNSLRYQRPGAEPFELLAGHGSAADFAADRLYRNVTLWPWPNRLRDGRYSHLGTEYQLTVNEQSTQTALHGLLFRLPVTVAERTVSLHDAAITLRYDYAGDDPGYPFAARIQVRYAIHRDGLTVTFGVRNNHRAPVPVGIGWHPYFTLGTAVDDLELQLPPARRVLIDKRMLPTGKTRKYDDFAESRPIAALRTDHCMVLEPGPGPNAAARLWSPGQGIGIELWQRRADFPYLHMFIPPDRRSIALEPVSCGIDAFNTGEGLHLLKPGAALTAQCGLRVFTK